MLESFIGAVESLRGNPWAPPLFICAFALCCQGLPTTLFPVAGGILFGVWGGTVCNVLGYTLGSTIAFFFSRRWGRGLWSRWRTEPLPGFFRRPHFLLLLVVRLTGFPPLLVMNLLSGVSEASYPAFAASTALGVLPWSAFMAFFAEVLWAGLLAGGMGGFKRTVMAHSQPLLIAVAAFVVLVSLAGWFGRRLLPQAAEGGSVKE